MVTYDVSSDDFPNTFNSKVDLGTLYCLEAVYGFIPLSLTAFMAAAMSSFVYLNFGLGAIWNEKKHFKIGPIKLWQSLALKKWRNPEFDTSANYWVASDSSVWHDCHTLDPGSIFDTSGLHSSQTFILR